MSRDEPAEDICQACGSEEQFSIRGKLHCARCKTILATCCEGGKGEGGQCGTSKS